MDEAQLQKVVCDFIRLSYPGVIFRSDGSGIRLTMGQAIAAKRVNSSRAFPDLEILEPRGNWHSCFIELKRDGATVYLKDGSLSANPHIQEQAAMITKLNSLGYYATFAVGFKQAREEIVSYMKLKRTP